MKVWWFMNRVPKWPLLTKISSETMEIRKKDSRSPYFDNIFFIICLKFALHAHSALSLPHMCRTWIWLKTNLSKYKINIAVVWLMYFCYFHKLKLKCGIYNAKYFFPATQNNTEKEPFSSNACFCALWFTILIKYGWFFGCC